MSDESLQQEIIQIGSVRWLDKNEIGEKLMCNWAGTSCSRTCKLREEGYGHPVVVVDIYKTIHQSDSGTDERMTPVSFVQVVLRKCNSTYLVLLTHKFFR